MCCWGAAAKRGRADPSSVTPAPPALSQEEAAGATAPAGQLLLPAVEDLQPELLFPLQVLRLPGGADGIEHCPGNARQVRGRGLSWPLLKSLHLIWRDKPGPSQRGLRVTRTDPSLPQACSEASGSAL